MENKKSRKKKNKSQFQPISALTRESCLNLIACACEGECRCNGALPRWFLTILDGQLIAWSFDNRDESVVINTMDDYLVVVRDGGVFISSQVEGPDNPQLSGEEPLSTAVEILRQGIINSATKNRITFSRD